MSRHSFQPCDDSQPGSTTRAATAPRSLLRALSSVALLASFVVLQGCAQLPPQTGRTVSSALQDTSTTRLGEAVAELTGAHPGESGLIALPLGMDAFAARARLADAAERSLDVQYYIWHDDVSGRLLFDTLRRAADRGVRVRLLLDDNNTVELQGLLRELASHANIEIRLFNPFPPGTVRAFDYLTDFSRLNRRMHNKSFTADNQATIVGGRNVGDEYFDVGEDVQFVDLDVLAIGRVVGDVSRDFDRYWASESAYPAERILARPQDDAAPRSTAPIDAIADDARSVAYLAAVDNQPFVKRMMARELVFQWARVHLVSDDPSKGLGLASKDELLWTRMLALLPKPERELDLVSPYFVPGEKGVEHFSALARRGVKVTIVTNSLEATDVIAVHAGYAKRREPLLESGVALYEIRRDADAPRSKGFSTGSGGGSSSSASSLHAKTFAIDRSTVFIGSFNFDPRSTRLNTEMGFVIESPALATAVTEAIVGRLEARSYRVEQGTGGALQWVARSDGQEKVWTEEPGTSVWRRLGVSLIALFPIDWLL